MTINSYKIILFSLSAIFLLPLFVYISNQKQLEWQYVNGYSVKIEGDIEEIEDFYISLEKRLDGYSDWINIVLTGELTNYEKGYAPFRMSNDKFVYFNKIYTATDMTELLTEYSKYLNSVLLNNKVNDTYSIHPELSRLYQFSLSLANYFSQSKSILIEDIIDLMKFDLNPYYYPDVNTSFVYIFLHKNENINSELKEIKKQIQVEVDDLNRFLDANVLINSENFQITNIDTLVLLGDHHKYLSSQFSHVYKYVPTVNNIVFNSRMSVMKNNIHHKKNKNLSTSTEFLNILSKIEEQLIEFQSRKDFQNKRMSDYSCKLVGDGEGELGILTSTINLFSKRKFTYRLEDFLSKSSDLLKREVKEQTELTYPFIENLPNKIYSKFIQQEKSLLLNINTE